MGSMQMIGFYVAAYFVALQTIQQRYCIPDDLYGRCQLKLPLNNKEVSDKIFFSFCDLR